MIGLIGIKLNEGTVKIKEDVPPKGITIDLKIDKITRAKEQLGVANVGFTYTVSYTPNTAVLQLTGDALITEAPEELDRIIKMWKEKHRLDEETGATILNAINPFVSYNALFILRIFNLPPHIAPPPVVVKKK
ncbi:MAG: hypothetical protein QXT45_00280 [Candidatus Bilamarchaeaceae archaeon]